MEAVLFTRPGRNTARILGWYIPGWTQLWWGEELYI